MIRNRNIICFASGWSYHPTSKHHIMRRLAQHNNVIWINWHASRRPTIRLDDLRAVVSKMRQIRKGSQRVDDAITVLTPFQVPLPGSRIARHINTISVSSAIRRILRQLPDWPVQLWSFAPDVGDLVGRFGEELDLYYCVDAFGEFPGYNRKIIERRERELVARSDLVITTSRPLYDAKKQWHSNVHLVAHGVDHASLSRAVTMTMPTPPEIAGLPRPIIGYVGVVGEWVDLDLLADLARNRPDASVVMIGPVLGSRGPCANVPNIHWLGEKDHATLPAYLQAFDVGLIPFRHVPLTRNANPIKLYEYLAAGVPVVSTALPAVQPMTGSVWLADDAASMNHACDQAIHRNSPADREQRSATMTAESWSSRLETITKLISGTVSRCPITVEPSRTPVEPPVLQAV